MPLRKREKRENAESRGEGGGSWPIKGLKGQSVTAEMKWGALLYKFMPGGQWFTSETVKKKQS